jgi:EAL domain-containing protein (putative c-di-GMP-specific phosphodiesterase class I)/ActR/RegA family two-component response regulator
MNLLVFDDDARIADLIIEIASECGWSVAAARDAVDFWDRLQVHRPDAIFLDMQLGTSDGVEQLRLLSQARFAGSVVLMSGFDPRVLSAAQEIGRSMGLAMRAVIEKPMRVARVRTVLGVLETAMSPAGGGPHDPTGAGRPQPEPIDAAAVAAAVAAGEMTLHLQPIVHAAHRRVVAAEGLVRWLHPVLGVVPPGEFVPVAEQDSEVIDQLTDWAIGTAAAHHKALAAQGLNIPIHVNVSGANLHELDFPDRIAAQLAALDVAPAGVGLEITETVATQDRRVTADILTRLRLKGFSLAIDDFGTGHSTLEALRRMPFSSIKIDRAFVSDLLTSQDSFNIVRSVIGLARTMGLTTVAEGVEDRRIADCLTELGIDAMQGYCFAPALPLDAFVDWVRNGGMPA